MSISTTSTTTGAALRNESNATTAIEDLPGVYATPAADAHDDAPFIKDFLALSQRMKMVWRRELEVDHVVLGRSAWEELLANSRKQEMQQTQQRRPGAGKDEHEIEVEVQVERDGMMKRDDAVAGGHMDAPEAPIARHAPTSDPKALPHIRPNPVRPSPHATPDPSRLDAGTPPTTNPLIPAPGIINHITAIDVAGSDFKHLYQDVVVQYNKLALHYRVLSEASDGLERRLRSVTKRYRQYKDWGDAMETRCAKLEGQLKTLEDEKRASRGTGSFEKGSTESVGGMGRGHVSVVESTGGKVPTARACSSISIDQMASSPPAPPIKQEPQPTTNAPLSQIAPALRPPQHAPPNDLRRKRSMSNLIASPAAPAKQSQLKAELLSSSPIILSQSTAQSMDLDDIGQPIVTPRKKRRLDPEQKAVELSAQANTVANTSSRVGVGMVRVVYADSPSMETTSSTPNPAATPITASRPDLRMPRSKAMVSSFTAGDLNSFSPRLTMSLDRPRERRPRPSREHAIDSVCEDGASDPAATYGPASDRSMATSQHLLASPGDTRALALTSHARPSGRQSPQRPGSTAEGDEAAEPATKLLTESRPLRKPEHVATPVIQKQTKKSSSTSKKIRSIRVNAPASIMTPLESSTARPVSTRRHSTTGTPHITTPQQNEPSDAIKSSASTTTEATVSARHRLRHRALEELSLEDFKINPEYNHGHKHAFHEVVRGKDARRCLQGCTRPDCCGGKFLAFAASTRDPLQPLTASQEQADTRLLQAYLGADDGETADDNDPGNRLARLPADERHRLLLQARARDLANKHGRHRHAYGRAQTPPGFWDADFPTTQEQARRREAGSAYERDKVEQRYREALRKGGAYKFRDE